MATTLLLLSALSVAAGFTPVAPPFASHTVPRAAATAGLFGFGRKKQEPAAASGGRPPAAGSELAIGADHVDVVELTLSAGQRKALAKAAKSARLDTIVVGAVESSADEVSAALAAVEMAYCEFSSVTKKPAAMLLANEMSVLIGAAVPEVQGNVALLYRPSSKNRFKSAMRV